jgi:hypothetical protein
VHPPRPPSFDHGVISFLWAFGLGLYISFGLIAVGVSKATSFILAVVAAFGIFLFVRLYGEEEVRAVPRQRGSTTREGA